MTDQDNEISPEGTASSSSGSDGGSVTVSRVALGRVLRSIYLARPLDPQSDVGRAFNELRAALDVEEGAPVDLIAVRRNHTRASLCVCGHAAMAHLPGCEGCGCREYRRAVPDPSEEEKGKRQGDE